MSSNEIFKWLTYSSALSVLFPIFATAVRWSLSLPFKILFAYLLMSALADGYSYYVVKIQHQTNADIFHSFRVIELILLVAFYFAIFDWPFKYLIHVLVLVLVFRYLFSFLDTTNSNLCFAIMAKSTLISFSAFYFYQLFDRLDVPNLLNHDLFWINSAILIYFGSTLLIVIFEPFIREAPVIIGRFLWAIQLSCNILLYLLLSIGIWQKTQK